MNRAPFTVTELAERWKCSDQHIYNLVKSGALRCIRLGKLIRIPAQAVEKFECGSSNTEESGALNSVTPPEPGGAQASETSTRRQKIVRLPSRRSLVLPAS